MKPLGFPTVVRVFCSVVFKIILSLAHVVFTKAVDVKTCFCNNVQASKYRSVGNTLQDFYRIVEARDQIILPREKWTLFVNISISLLSGTQRAKTFDRLAQPITSSVRWRTEVFKIQGFVCKRFLPSPPSPPYFIFLALSPFSARAKHQKSRSLLPNPTETLATQAKTNHNSLPTHSNQWDCFVLYRS